MAGVPVIVLLRATPAKHVLFCFIYVVTVVVVISALVLVKLNHIMFAQEFCR
jgi:hypothetical protein